MMRLGLLRQDHKHWPGVHVTVLAVMAGLLVAAFGWSNTSALAEEQPLFTFVQWNDTHVDASPSPPYTLANEKMDYLVSSINSQTYFPTPDFVIGVGDMANTRVAEDFDVLEARLANLNVPYYPVMGNHENDGREDNAAYEALYNGLFGAGMTNYTFERDGIEFIVLNDSGGGHNAARNAWLDSVLNASPGTPKIIAAHIPLVPLREESVLSQSFGFSSYVVRDAELLGIVNAHSDEILAVLSGHLHITGAVQRNGIYHITTSGTGSYPSDYAHYQVFADRVHVEMYSLPQSLQTPETDIHGLPRWPIDYTDATHLTHEAYVRGNASERSFDISTDISPPPYVPRAPRVVSNFSSDPNLAADWTESTFYGVNAATATWNPTDMDLDLTASSSSTGMTLLRKNGETWTDTDEVTLTVSDFSTSSETLWSIMGLVVSASPTPTLTDNSYYRFDLEGAYNFGAEGYQYAYVLRRGGNQVVGTVALGATAPSDDVRLSIVQDGEYYVFMADGEVVFLDSYYSNDTLPYYSIVIGSLSGNAFTVTVDDFGTTVLAMPGDANADGRVDAADAAILAANWQSSEASWSQGDFNGDGNVDDVDATLLAGNWQSAAAECSVPEPCTWGLLCGGLTLLALRRLRQDNTN